ncbi:MAG: CDP-alcohol phosphatidyltransferase family protein [Solirubrobacteraceae bacterium]|nr:CDP-alcohol phosphatidyltransferase family protein [Solirubrobacteraceae bacterium]
MSEPGRGRGRLTFRRFAGLDRSGPPPPETLPGAPLRPWTVPNAIGFLRLALIPVFLWSAWRADGAGAAPAALFAVISWGDYADGIAARLTGQYSRLGAMLDPVVDRLLVIGGILVCWRFDLLPAWLLATLVVREALMLVLGAIVVPRGVELRINWWGRWGVWPAMSAIFFGLVGLRGLGSVLLAVGVALLLIASVEYVRAALPQLTGGKTST